MFTKLQSFEPVLCEVMISLERDANHRCELGQKLTRRVLGRRVGAEPFNTGELTPSRETEKAPWVGPVDPNTLIPVPIHYHYIVSLNCLRK
jgi:hypothetical protein